LPVRSNVTWVGPLAVTVALQMSADSFESSTTVTVSVLVEAPLH
jgi:hypothetical protein